MAFEVSSGRAVLIISLLPQCLLYNTGLKAPHRPAASSEGGSTELKKQDKGNNRQRTLTRPLLDPEFRMLCLARPMTVQGTPFAYGGGLNESWLNPGRRTSRLRQENKGLAGADKNTERLAGATTEVLISSRTETIVTEGEAATHGQSTCNTKVSLLLLASLILFILCLMRQITKILSGTCCLKQVKVEPSKSTEAPRVSPFGAGIMKVGISHRIFMHQ